MIDGIEVLSQTEIMEAPYLYLVVIISFIISTIIFTLLEHYISNNISVLSPILALLLSIIIGIAYSNVKKEPTGKYEYKVTIDKSVSFVEFTEQYDIIDKDGSIYTIRDIEYE